MSSLPITTYQRYAGLPFAGRTEVKPAARVAAAAAVRSPSQEPHERLYEGELLSEQELLSVQTTKPNAALEGLPMHARRALAAYASHAGTPLHNAQKSGLLLDILV